MAVRGALTGLPISQGGGSEKRSDQKYTRTGVLSSVRWQL